MFGWLQEIPPRLMEIIEAQGTLAARRLRVLGVQFALCVTLGLVAAAAICGLLAGVVILLAPEVGVAAALLIVSGSTALGMTAIVLTLHRALTRSRSAAEAEAAMARERFNEAFSPTDESATESGETEGRESSSSFIVHAVSAAASNPAACVGAAFAVTSILGLRRTVGLIRAASTIASAGSIISELTGSLNGVDRPKEDHTSSEDNHDRDWSPESRGVTAE